jgi:hypothetical protein
MNEVQIPYIVKQKSHIINTGIINISMEFHEQLERLLDRELKPQKPVPKAVDK